MSSGCRAREMLLVLVLASCSWAAVGAASANAQACEPHPEVCGGGDEDCDGVANEEGASGCQWYRRDADGDGFGVSTDSKCLCFPQGQYTASTLNAADCNDGNAAVRPSAVERCDTPWDDNCDGRINDENATGCVTYYEDTDRDGYGSGSGRCLCAPTSPFDVATRTDCDDLHATRNPGMTEICNGVDDDCDARVDQADVLESTLCPPRPHAVQTGCASVRGCVATCATGYFDVDGLYGNGCEVLQDSLDREGVGNLCVVASNLGARDDTQSPVTATGNIVPAIDLDWFTFTLTDGSDPGSEVGFRIWLAQNPDQAYRIDVYRGTCVQSAAVRALTFSGTIAGRYYVRVYRLDGQASAANENYELAVGPPSGFVLPPAPTLRPGGGVVLPH